MIRPLMFAVCVMLSTAAVAQDPADFAPPTPVEQHKMLAQDVGTWDAKVQYWMSPDADPETSTAVEVNRMMGDFWLICDFKGTMMGAPFSGHSQTGYDPVQKKFVGSWIDSMSPHVIDCKGTVNDKGELVMTGTGIDCMTKQPMTCKMITRHNADGTRTFEMHAPGEDGKWFKVMQIDYTKRQES